MWILFAAGSALFAGVTAILAKIGIKNTDSNVATAIRTGVVLVFSWLMVFVVGSQTEIGNISAKTMIFLVLSGLATGASWICYFRALQIGDINKVVPVDKASIILTLILAFIILKEPISYIKAIAIALIGVGTFLMIEKKSGTETEAKYGNRWIIYAVLSAIFASLTSILGKIGISDVESNLGTAIRTAVVLVMAWLIVFIQNKQGEIKKIDSKSGLFIILSGITTGLSWLCYYRALHDGLASVVVPIDKLSIVITIIFARIFMKEKLTPKALGGLILIVIGTLGMII